MKEIHGTDKVKKTSNQPPPSPEEVEIFKIVEEMPRFPGCEQTLMPKKEKEKCAKKNC